MQTDVKNNRNTPCGKAQMVNDIFYYQNAFYCSFNRFAGVIVSVVASSVVDRNSSPSMVNPKTYKLIFVVYLLRA
jgi:hypothetical protein